ncbi:hypothetical protein ABZS29_08810 [Kribbella sp. NPDC005582]|uniref:hypothetical protein n=1 Tax=Kribbella sp. NPDC005582 TaxID=3156893 RepID=UPI0033AF73A9
MSTPAKVLGGWLGVGTLLMVALIEELPAVPVVLGGWLVGCFVVGGVVVADALRLRRREDLDGLQRSANVVKVAAVPFFLVNFVALARVVLHVGAGDRQHFGLRGFLTAVLFVVLTYLVMLTTSAYSIGCLAVMRQNGQIGPGFFGLHLILQFLFVADVVSAIVVIEVARNRLGTAQRPGPLSRQLLTGVLLIFSVFATIWLVMLPGFYSDYPLFDADWHYRLGFVPFVAFLILVVVPIVPLVAFRTAVRWYLAGDVDALRRSNRTVKLTMIPLFLQNFFLCAVITGVISYFPLRMMQKPSDAWLAVPFVSLSIVPGIIGAYLMLLPTSIYGITCLALMLRQRLITPRFCAIHVVLHLLFVADIISALVVSSRDKRRAAVPVAR